MSVERKSLLESINVRFDKDQGEKLRNTVNATKSILDSIGSSSAASIDSKK